MKLNQIKSIVLLLVLSLEVVVAQTNSLHLPPIATGPFKPDWNSLTNYQTPDWFRDAKFGIWISWGPQSVPCAGDWYARNMYIQGSSAYKHHLQHYGHPSTNGYKDILPLWKAEKFDPATLVKLYQKAGARYLVTLANHHDNFDCWDSKYQPWNSVNIGPKRDIVGLCKAAAEREGLHFGVSIHNINTWGWYDPARGADTNGPLAGVPYDGLLTKADGKGKWWEGYNPQDLYGPPHRPGPDGDAPTPAFMANWFLRTKDLIDRYQPDLVIFDLASPVQMWRQWVKFEDVTNLQTVDERAGMLIAAHYYNQESKWHGAANEGIITLKALPPERRAAVTLAMERDYTTQTMENPWELEDSMGDWFYRDNDRYMTPAQVVDMLAETVCRNGNLLLNVVLKPDGSLPDIEAEALLSVGQWLKVNGEAIYGTRPWKVFGEGTTRVKTRAEWHEENKPRTLPQYTSDDIRFTQNKDGRTFYAIVLGVPTGAARIKSLAGEKIAGITLLGSDAKLDWKQEADALVIQPVAKWPCDYAVAFKITLGK